MAPKRRRLPFSARFISNELDELETGQPFRHYVFIDPEHVLVVIHFGNPAIDDLNWSVVRIKLDPLPFGVVVIVVMDIGKLSPDSCAG